MAATDAPATLAELRTEFLESVREVTGVTVMNTLADRYLNTGLQDMHAERWWWAERRATILTHPTYSTGTIEIASTSRTALRGAGTAWDTTIAGLGFANLRVGGKVSLGSDGTVYTVSGVTDGTNATLADRYIGNIAVASDLAAASASYVYYEDEYALESDFDDLLDVRFFDEDRKIKLVGPQEFYRIFARNRERDEPTTASLIELGPSGSVSLRRRIVFGPAPDTTYLIPYRYYTTNLAVSSAGVAAANLSATTDQPIVPLRYRMGIVYKAKARWYQDRKDDARMETAKSDYETLMLRARQAAASGPADDRPRIVPQVAGYMAHARNPYVRRGTGLTTGTRWDRLQE